VDAGGVAVTPEEEESLGAAAYGSLVVAGEAAVVLVVLVVLVAPAADALRTAGSWPSCSLSASTPKTATKLAVAAAANRRGVGARRRRVLGSSAGTATASSPGLNRA
jgi:hypothetical protein